MNMLRDLRRSECEYYRKDIRAREDHAWHISNILYDHVDELVKIYPFHDGTRKTLIETVNKQIRQVVHSKMDLKNHIVVKEMRESKIDWLVEPMFGNQKLQFSNILSEYNRWYHDNTYSPSSDCYRMFKLPTSEDASASDNTGWNEAEMDREREVAQVGNKRYRDDHRSERSDD